MKLSLLMTLKTFMVMVGLSNGSDLFPDEMLDVGCLNIAITNHIRTLASFKQEPEFSQQILASNLSAIIWDQNKILGTVHKCLKIFSQPSDTGSRNFNRFMQDVNIIRAKEKTLNIFTSECLQNLTKHLNSRIYNFAINLETNNVTCLRGNWIKKAHDVVGRLTNVVGSSKSQKYTNEILKIGYVPFYPSFLRKKGLGAEIYLWKHIAKFLKIRVEFALASGAKRNFWKVIDMVNEGKFHMSGIPSNLMMENAKNAEPTVSLFQRHSYFVFRLPQKVSKYHTLIEPLDNSVWLLLAISVLSVCIALVSTVKFITGSVEDLFLLCSVSYAILISECLPRKLVSLNTHASVQSLLAFWIPTSCLMSLAYQSQLLGSIVMVRSTPPIDSYEDIIDKNITLYIARGGSSKFNSLKESLLPSARQVFQNHLVEYSLIWDGTVERPPDRIYQELKAGTAGVARKSSGSGFTYDSVFDHSTGTDCFFTRKAKSVDTGWKWVVYYVGLNHPLYERINLAYQILSETNLHGKMYYKKSTEYYRSFHSCHLELGRSSREIGTHEIAPAFFLVGGGLALSLIAFAAETAIVRSLKNGRPKNKSRTY